MSILTSLYELYWAYVYYGCNNNKKLATALLTSYRNKRDSDSWILCSVLFINVLLTCAKLRNFYSLKRIIRRILENNRKTFWELQNRIFSKILSIIASSLTTPRGDVTVIRQCSTKTLCLPTPQSFRTLCYSVPLKQLLVVNAHLFSLRSYLLFDSDFVCTCIPWNMYFQAWDTKMDCFIGKYTTLLYCLLLQNHLWNANVPPSGVLSFFSFLVVCTEFQMKPRYI